MKGLEMLLGSMMGGAGFDLGAAAANMETVLATLMNYQRRQTEALEKIAASLGNDKAISTDDILAANGIEVLPGIVATPAETGEERAPRTAPQDVIVNYDGRRDDVA